MVDRRPVTPEHAGAVHRDDAAMGLPRFPARGSEGLPRLSPTDEIAGDWVRRGARKGGRGSPCRWTGSARIPDRSGRWPEFDRADDAAGADARRADGRLLVPDSQISRGKGRVARKCRTITSTG